MYPLLAAVLPSLTFVLIQRCLSNPRCLHPARTVRLLRPSRPVREGALSQASVAQQQPDPLLRRKTGSIYILGAGLLLGAPGIATRSILTTSNKKANGSGGLERNC